MFTTTQLGAVEGTQLDQLAWAGKLILAHQLSSESLAAQAQACYILQVKLGIEHDRLEQLTRQIEQGQSRLRTALSGRHGRKAASQVRAGTLSM